VANLNSFAEKNHEKQKEFGHLCKQLILNIRKYVSKYLVRNYMKANKKMSGFSKSENVSV